MNFKYWRKENPKNFAKIIEYEKKPTTQFRHLKLSDFWDKQRGDIMRQDCGRFDFQNMKALLSSASLYSILADPLVLNWVSSEWELRHRNTVSMNYFTVFQDGLVLCQHAYTSAGLSGVGPTTHVRIRGKSSYSKLRKQNQRKVTLRKVENVCQLVSNGKL